VFPKTQPNRSPAATAPAPISDDEKATLKKLDEMKEEQGPCSWYDYCSFAENPWEAAWCSMVGPFDCASAVAYGKGAAGSMADKMYPGGGPGGNGTAEQKRKWNAFHHAYWFAMIGASGAYTRDEAMLLGAAHERGAYLSRIDKGETNPNVDFGEQDSRADMYNNAAGFDIGKRYPVKGGGAHHQVWADEMATEIKAKVDSGELAMYGK
jgi:hypothetical protein